MSVWDRPGCSEVEVGWSSNDLFLDNLSKFDSQSDTFSLDTSELCDAYTITRSLDDIPQK